jgi:hypothetical protein
MSSSNRFGRVPIATWAGIGAGTLLCLGAAITWLVVAQPFAGGASDPFSQRIKDAVSFPLWYPTQPPAGFHVSRRGITQPQAGVVVLELDGPNHAKLFLSEEAVPPSYDIGAYFEHFSSLKETALPDGSLATGYLGDGRIAVASRINTKTWAIVNTNAHVPPVQLGRMLSTLAIAH